VFETRSAVGRGAEGCPLTTDLEVDTTERPVGRDDDDREPPQRVGRDGRRERSWIIDDFLVVAESEGRYSRSAGAAGSMNRA
jgi:hypothetical protein